MKIRSKARFITSSLSVDERIKSTEFNNDGTLGPIIKNRSFGAYQDYKMEYPSYSSLASSFDKDLINEFYKIVIDDANRKDRGIVRTPPLTIKRDPYSGKSYRYLSEDYRFNSLVISSIAENILDSKHIPLIGGLLSSDLEYAKYSVSLNIDDKNLNEVYLRELFPLPKDDRIILTLPKNKVNHKFLFNDKDFLDYIKVNNYFNGMYVISKYSYHDKLEAIKNGVTLSYKDPYFIDNFKLDPFQKKWLDKEVEKLITHSLNHKKEKSEQLNHSFFYKVLGANSNVLLKNNDNVLPLKDETIALLGLYQETPIISGDFKDIHTKNDTSLFVEIKKHTNNVSYFPLYDQYLRINTKELGDILPKLKDFDRVIIVLSDVDYYVREGIDKRSLRFKDEIYELYKKVKGYNANIITILEQQTRTNCIIGIVRNHMLRPFDAHRQKASCFLGQHIQTGTNARDNDTASKTAVLHHIERGRRAHIHHNGIFVATVAQRNNVAESVGTERSRVRVRNRTIQAVLGTHHLHRAFKQRLQRLDPRTFMSGHHCGKAHVGNRRGFNLRKTDQSANAVHHLVAGRFFARGKAPVVHHLVALKNA